MEAKTPTGMKIHIFLHLQPCQTHAIEKFRNQMIVQNGHVIDLAILKPGFELARPFQNQGRFQNGQVNGREHYHYKYMTEHIIL